MFDGLLSAQTAENSENGTESGWAAHTVSLGLEGDESTANFCAHDETLGTVMRKGGTYDGARAV